MMKQAIVIGLLACGMGLCACTDRVVYKDPSAPVEQRVEDLL